MNVSVIGVTFIQCNFSLSVSQRAFGYREELGFRVQGRVRGSGKGNFTLHTFAKSLPGMVLAIKKVHT